jgi:hypothetical protein
MLDKRRIKMKFLSITTYNIDKLSEIAQAADNLGKNPPEGYKLLAMYSCQGNPFPGMELERGDMVSVSIIESESAEAMASANLQLVLAGATVNRIPVMEIPTGDAEGTVEKLKS